METTSINIDQFFAQFARQPFVDPISNASFIDSIDTLASWTNQVDSFTDPKFLRIFLHESTHHSSFISHVGGALSSLAFSSYTLFWEVSKGQDKYTLATGDIVLFQAIWQFLEPLIEGLAQFQEYDAIGGTAKSGTNTYLWLETVRRELLKSSNNKTFDSLILFSNHFFQGIRVDSLNWKESKKRLLKQKADQPPHYLLGYLAIKSVYQTLSQKCELFSKDSDFFVLFMNDFWFADHRLADLLLNIFRPEEVSIEAYVNFRISEIVEYFKDRLELLFENCNEFALECEAFYSDKSKPYEDKKTPSYWNTDFKTDFMSQGIRIASHNMRLGSPKFFWFRREFRYSYEDVNIESDGETLEVTLKRGEEVKVIPTIFLLQKGVYTGTIEGVLNIDQYRPVTFITVGDIPISIFDPMDMCWNSKGLVDQYREFPSFKQILLMKERLHDFSNVVEGSTLEENILYNRKEMTEQIVSVFGQLAFRCGSSQAKIIYEKLSSSGFEPILREDFDLVSFISLISGCGFVDLVGFYLDQPEQVEKVINLTVKINAEFADQFSWQPFILIENRYLMCKI